MCLLTWLEGVYFYFQFISLLVRVYFQYRGWIWRKTALYDFFLSCNLEKNYEQNSKYSHSTIYFPHLWNDTRIAKLYKTLKKNSTIFTASLLYHYFIFLRSLLENVHFVEISLIILMGRKWNKLVLGSQIVLPPIENYRVLM